MHSFALLLKSKILPLTSVWRYLQTVWHFGDARMGKKKGVESYVTRSRNFSRDLRMEGFGAGEGAKTAIRGTSNKELKTMKDT